MDNNILKPSRLSGEVVALFNKRNPAAVQRSRQQLDIYISFLSGLHHNDGSMVLNTEELCFLRRVFQAQIDQLPELTLDAVQTVRQHIQLAGRWHTAQSEQDLWKTLNFLPSFDLQAAFNQLLRPCKRYSFPEGNLLWQGPSVPSELKRAETFFWIILRMFRVAAADQP